MFSKYTSPSYSTEENVTCRFIVGRRLTLRFCPMPLPGRVFSFKNGGSNVICHGKYSCLMVPRVRQFQSISVAKHARHHRTAAFAGVR